MKKKVKCWMIGSYFLVLAVFLLVYLAIQRQTEEKFKELYRERQTAVMHQTMLAVDEQVEAVRKMCLAIAQEPYVQYFPFVGSQLSRYDRESATKLLQSIRRHYTDHPFVEDIYLFYENSGRIANANGFYREEDFYRMEWSFEDAQMQSRGRELLRQKGSFFLPVAWMKNGAKRTENIAYFYEIGHSMGNREGKAAKLVVLLKKEWMDEMILPMSGMGKTTIWRADNGEELYSAYGEGFPREEFEKDIGEVEEGSKDIDKDNGEVEKNAQDYQEILDGRYLLTRLNAEKTGWIYETLISYAPIAEQTHEAVSPMRLGLFFYLLLGIPACFFLAVWNYKPIRQLTAHIEAIGLGEGAEHRNELEYIQSGISRLKQKYEELELQYNSTRLAFDSASRKLIKNRERLGEGILLQLIGGYWRDGEEMEEKLCSMGIVFPYPKFCLAAVRVEENLTNGTNAINVINGTNTINETNVINRTNAINETNIAGRELQTEERENAWKFISAEERDLRLFVLKNVAQEYLAPIGPAFPVSADAEQIYLVINLAEDGKGRDEQACCADEVNGELYSYLERLLQEMMEYLQRELQMSISIGLGLPCDEIRELNQSLKQAKQALDYGFILGRPSFISYERIKQGEREGGFFEKKSCTSRLEKQIWGRLCQKDGEGCRDLLKDFYRGILAQKISVEEGRGIHMLLSDMAMRVVEQSNAAEETAEVCQDMVAGILSSTTLPDACSALGKLLAVLCEARSETEGEQELKGRILQAIEEGFQNPDFSLSMCAEHFEISPEHLSRTVKQLTGRKFIDIVNGLRLERAKRYLLETDKKMEEIAELSGYRTTKSFFRSFKQAEGVPPGAWRKAGQRGRQD